MGDKLRKKNLVGRVARDPWKAILGPRQPRYHIPEVAEQLIYQVDKALFERKFHDALTVGVILTKWSEYDSHYYGQAPAVMASIYSVCGLVSESEQMIIDAQKKVSSQCRECRGQYYKRLGTFYIYQHMNDKALKAYTTSANLFLEADKPKEAALSILNRGVTKYIMHQYPEALEDEEYALELLGPEFSIYTIMAYINIASVLVALGDIERALKEIKGVQEKLVGEHDIERPKLILRWVRALLLETQENLKDAGEMMDRIEERMRRLDMKAELRVLLADRARVAQQEDTILRSVRKALEIEEIPRVRVLIEKTMQEPSRENILKWRNALDSYVPPFPATV